MMHMREVRSLFNRATCGFELRVNTLDIVQLG
jgi:hypothetical protein